MRRLLRAGKLVFADRGYHASRVDDIVRAAHTSHGTFYLYFTNKDDLLRSLAEECAQDMRAIVESLGEIGPGPAGLAEISRFLREFVQLSHRHGSVLRAWAEGASDDVELRRIGARTWRHMAARIDERIVHSAASGPASASARGVDSRAASVALIAMLERFAYFVVSRGVATDDDATGYSSVARVVHRGFFGGIGPRVT
jgi:AcrR family transcriptional regulator